jgi:deaminated glutathione amidase
VIVDPWGHIVAERDDDAVGILVANIDLKAVEAARASVPSLANARGFSLSVNPRGAP